MLSFNEIAATIRTPGVFVEFDSSRALPGLPGQQHKILVIGQRLAAGTVAEGVPTLVTGADQAEGFFGRGSMIAAMFHALKAANPRTESWAIALDDDGGGAAAAGTITVTGPATAAGTIVLYIGGKRIKVAVASGDADSAIATAIDAAVNAETDLPVTSGVAVAVVTLTARNKGVAGDYIDLRLNYYQGEAIPAGVGLAIVDMTGGTTNPDVATAITAMGDDQYHTIICAYSDAANLTALETELTRRWDGMTQIEGHAFIAHRGETVGNLSTFGNARNAIQLTAIGTGDVPEAPWAWAAVVGGVDAKEPDPARPRQTLALPGLKPPAEGTRFTRDERDILLFDGISTYTVGAGNVVRIERLITTYQTNAQSVADASYLDITTVRNLAYLRFSWRAMISIKFPRHKLADDGTEFAAGQAVATPEILKNETIALARNWEEAGLVEKVDQFIADLVVSRDGADSDRVNLIIPPDLVNGLRVVAAQIQFRV